MTTVKCPCGFDSKVAMPKGSHNVGELKKKLDMAWIMFMNGDSVWICRSCENLINVAALKISNILGSTYWTATSVLPKRGNDLVRFHIPNA